MIEMVIQKNFKSEYWMVEPEHFDHKALKVGHETNINVSYDMQNKDGDFDEHFVVRFTLRRMADRSYKFRCPGCDRFDDRLFLCEGTDNRWLCNDCFSPIFVRLIADDDF